MPRKYVAVLLAAIALATYSNALHAPFVWDDDTSITTNQSIHEITTSLNPPIETPVAGRPVVNVSLALNYAFGGLDTTGYHVLNLAILVACALLLFGIVSRTLRRRRGHVQQDHQLSNDGVALIAALVWMVHPLLSETVDYTTQRTESLMGFFFLLTLYASIRALDTNKSRRAKAAETRGRAARGAATTGGAALSGPPLWTAIAIASCAAGMATKESMAVAPIAIVLYDVLFEFESLADALAARRVLYAGLALTWVELSAMMWHWPRSTVGGAVVSPVTYALNQAQMVVHYLWLSVWPHALVVDYGVPQTLHVADVLPQLAAIALLLAAIVVALVRWPPAGFLGAMCVLTLAPTSSIIPIWTEVGAERRMFLPLAALVVLAVTLVARLPRRAIVAAASLVIAALAIRTFERNRDYASALTLWQRVVDVRPHGRARFAFANELMSAGRHEDATTQLRLAIADYPDARAGLGTELLLQGKLQEGIDTLQAFVDANPSLPNRIPALALLAQAHRALAEQALAQHDAKRAIVEATKSLGFDANNADAHNDLGAALASEGDLSAAIREFEAAVRIDPRLASARSNLERATAMVQGR
jgi:tetratricopeptide (TPR) repeat protein